MTSNGQEPARDEDLDGGWDVDEAPKPTVPPPTRAFEAFESSPSAPILRASSRVPISPAELDSTPLDSEWDAPPLVPAKQQTPATAQVPKPAPRGPSKDISSTKARKLWEREQRAKKKAAAAFASKDRKREKKAARRKAARLEQAEAAAKANPSPTLAPKPAQPVKRTRTSEKAPRKLERPSIRPSEPVEAFDEPRVPRAYESQANARTLDTRTLLGVAIILAIVMVGVWFVSRR